MQIKTPLTDDTAKKLKIGDRVTITGTIYTARDAAHKKIYELHKQNQELPLELKDKMSAGIVFSDSSMNADVAAVQENTSEFSDAMDALSVLGFTRADILVALRGVDTSKMTAEEIIKTAMKKLVKN